jgi:hypothetical protein
MTVGKGYQREPVGKLFKKRLYLKKAFKWGSLDKRLKRTVGKGYRWGTVGKRF